MGKATRHVWTAFRLAAVLGRLAACDHWSCARNQLHAGSGVSNKTSEMDIKILYAEDIALAAGLTMDYTTIKVSVPFVHIYRVNVPAFMVHFILAMIRILNIKNFWMSLKH